jgi:hypothetical protein
MMSLTPARSKIHLVEFANSVFVGFTPTGFNLKIED